MPFSHHVDAEQCTVFTTLSGEVSFAEANAFLRTLQEDPAYDSSFSELVDLMQVTGTTMSGDDMRRLAERDPFAPASKRAFVVPNALVYGLSRMYESHSSLRAERRIRIFTSFPEARAWLGLPDS